MDRTTVLSTMNSVAPVGISHPPSICFEGTTEAFASRSSYDIAYSEKAGQGNYRVCILGNSCPDFRYLVSRLSNDTTLLYDGRLLSQHHARIGRQQGRLKRTILTGRAGYKCERCGHRLGSARGNRRGELHHIKPLHLGGFHTEENTLLLCVDCHLEVSRQERFLSMSPERQAWVKHLTSSY